LPLLKFQPSYKIKFIALTFPFSTTVDKNRTQCFKSKDSFFLSEPCALMAYKGAVLRLLYQETSCTV